MPKAAQDKASPRGRSRIANACVRCRKKKVKCSGSEPCQECVENSAACIFEQPIKKIMVSERDLLDLVSTANRYKFKEARPSIDTYDDPGPSSWEMPAVPITDPPSATLSSQRPIPRGDTANLAQAVIPVEEIVPSMLNPLTSSESFYFVDSSGRQRYLGGSSSISFSWQIRCFLKRIVGDHVFINLVPNSEEQTYTMASVSVRDALSATSPVNEELPTREYARYLVETTLFHLGEMYHVFERESFMTKIDQFYGDGSNSRPLHALWHVQLLLVIAFGKLFLRRGASTLGPPGAMEFLWAMRLHSDSLDIWSDPVLRLEILCLISLYLNTVDMRASAYVFIGQAMHMALSQGMNREVPEGYLDNVEYRRRRRVWWTIYIIDRKLSVTTGTPLSVHDNDIDISKPEENDLGFSNGALNLHIKMAKLDGDVKRAAYRINGAVDIFFIKGIQDVFSSMVKLADNFRGNFSFGSPSTRMVSRTAATLHIMYHQSTIISTRPILFVLIKQRLAPLLAGLSIVDKVSEPVVGLLNTCVGAAMSIINILSGLHQEDLVEPFFPMDLQAVFSAGFILILTSIAYPSLTIDDGCIGKSDEILAWMSSKGNMPANSRRQDLAELRAAAAHINADHGQSSVDMSELNLPPGQNGSWDMLASAGGMMSQSITENDDFWAGILKEMRQDYSG